MRLRSYLKQYGGVQFADRDVNDVDLLVFAQLAYVDFSNKRLYRGMPLRDALTGIADIKAAEPSEVRYRFQHKDDRELCLLAASAPRYSGILFFDFASNWDPQEEKQFAALALKLPDGRTIVAFRGTDNTLSGWKEDFNLAYMDSVPSQRMAAAYIEGIATEAQRMILCGHSKGGNLALFAATSAREEVGERIECAVSFDGPGLSAEMIQTGAFRRREPRMRVIIPRGSLVGLLFDQPSDVRIVQSRSVSMLQHYPYFWKTEGMDFLYADTLSRINALAGRTLMGLLKDLTPEIREKFVEAVYEIIAETRADTLNDLTGRWLQSAAAIAGKLFETDRETYRLFLKVLSAFLKAAAEALKDSFLQEE